MNKILILTLALLMIVPVLASCFGGNGTTPATTPPPVNPGELVKLPEGVYEDEVYRVIGMKGDEPQYTNFEVASALTGDAIGDAVWQRNELIKQKYGFEIKFDAEDNTAKNKMQASFETQDDLYDLCLLRSSEVGVFAQQGFLMDLNDTKYINLAHPTWNKDFNDALTVGGKLFFASNNFLLQNKMRTSIIFYNREMARANGYIDDGEYMEEYYVESGNWDLSIFADMVKECSDTSTAITSKFGLAADDRYQFTSFCIGGGFTFCDNDGEDVTLYKFDTDRKNIMSAVAEFGFDGKQSFYSMFSAGSAAYDDAEKIFIDQRALFYSAYVGAFTNLKEKAEFEYGVLPYPKYDDEQDRYYSFLNGYGTVAAIPYTIYDDDKAGYMLEALAEESHASTYPTFIKAQVQVQENFYDEVAAKTLELVLDSMYVDLATLYDPEGIVTNVGNEALRYKDTSTFKQLYDNKYKTAKTVLEEIAGTLATTETWWK